MSLALKKLKNFQGRSGPLLLIIMDGVGIGKRDESDGVFMANTPCLDELFQSDLYTTLKAHGTAVGMPSDEDMGNSEVGHNALGAGRVFAQGAKLVSEAISSGRIFKTDLWNNLVNGAKKPGAAFHLIGLLSDGNVHSHIDHLFALIEQCVKEGVKKIRLHVLADGRDVYEKSASLYISKTEKFIAQLNQKYSADIRIASGGGRMVVTMDRYKADWSIVKRGWDAHVLGKARMFENATEAVETYYKEDPKITDQYLNSFVIAENGRPIGTINDGDSVVIFNFRGDRAIELTRAFEEKDFNEFERERYPKVHFAGMMQYDGDLMIPKHFLVSPPQLDRTVSEYLCANGVTSFAISETQKFGHVTYFWNGNKSGYIDHQLEDYFEITSDRIQFDQAPKMKAYEITDKAIELLRSGKYKFGRINYPNGDMVGHTGVERAIITSVEAVDECLTKILPVIKELRGVAIILADHGNADEMFVMKDGKKIVKTSHSLNPVPFIIVDNDYHGEYHIARLKTRGLSNVASTILNLLGFETVSDYDPSLITFEKP